MGRKNGPRQVGGASDAANELLGLRGVLLVVGAEEERPFAPDRPAEREAVLQALEVRLRGLAGGMLGGDPVPLAERVHRAFQLVGPRLRDHVDEAACRAPELGGRALVDDHHLLDRVLVECEGRALPAALLAEEGVVEVGAVDDEVVEDAALAADVQFVAVRPLGEGRARREQGQIEEVAAVRRQPFDHLVGEPLRSRHVVGGGRLVRVLADRDLLGDDLLQREVEVQGLADTKGQTGDPLHPPLGVLRHDQFVGTERQQGAGEGPRCGRLDGGHESGLAVLNQHVGALDRRSAWAADDSADDPGRCFGLGCGGDGACGGGRDQQDGGEGRTERHHGSARLVARFGALDDSGRLGGAGW